MLFAWELAIVSILILSGAEAALYGKKSAVMHVDETSFNREVERTNSAVMVEFYAPWCGHCQALAPEYDKAAETMRGIATFAAVDCDNQANKNLCGRQGVKGFPTLKIFKASDKKGVPIVMEYQEARNAKAMVSGLSRAIPNRVTEVLVDQLEEFLAKNNNTAKAIVFSNKTKQGLKQRPSSLWRSLAIQFMDTITFAQIDKSDAVQEKLGINTFPTIILLPGGNEPPKVFPGKPDKKSLYDFFASAKLASSASTEKSAEEKPAEEKPAEEKPAEEKPAEEKSAAEEPTEKKPAEKPKHEIPSLSSLVELRESCLARNSKMCILALADDESAYAGLKFVYEKLQNRGPPFAFQTFTINASSEHGKEIIELINLGSERPQIFVVHRRGWFKRFTGDSAKADELLAWTDAIKMGEGTKQVLPEQVMDSGEGAEEAKAEEKTEKKTEKKTEEKAEETKEEKAEEKTEEKTEEKIVKDEL